MINWIKISPSSVLPEEGDKILIIAQDKDNNRAIYPCTYKHSKTSKLDAWHYRKKNITTLILIKE